MELIVDEVCAEVRNYFINKAEDIHAGDFSITSSVITPSDFLVEGQYFRIVGSKFNDGVYVFTPAKLEDLKDEAFSGEIWSMSVPSAFISLCQDINDWQTKYGGIDSASMSPYQSESFGKYSYSKGYGGSSESGGNFNDAGYQNAFANRLQRWRRLSIT